MSSIPDTRGGDAGVGVVPRIADQVARSGTMATIDAGVARRRMVVSVGAQILSQGAVSGLGIVVVKIMTGSLGLEVYGLYATAYNLVFTFSLLTDVGLSAVTPVEIAKAPERAREIISENLGLRLTMSAVFVPAVFAVGLLFYPRAGSQLHIAILVMASFLLFDSVRQVVSAYLTAHIRNDIVAVIAAGQQIVVLAVCAAVASAHWGLIGFVAAYVAGNAVAAVAAVAVVGRSVRLRPTFRVAGWPAIFRVSLAIGSIQILNMIYIKVDTVIISIIKGPVATGIYNISYLLISAFATLPAFIMSALMPALANARPAEFRRLVLRSYAYICLVGCLVAAIGVASGPELVVLVSDSSFSAAYVPFAILIVANVFIGLNAVVGTAAVVTKRHQRFITISAVSLVLNIALNLVLVPLWSIKGAAVATLLCELVSVMLARRIFRQETGIAIDAFVALVKPAIAGVLAGASSWFVARDLSGSGLIPRILLTSLSCAFVFMIVLVIVRGVPDEVAVAAQAQLRRRTRKGKHHSRTSNR